MRALTYVAVGALALTAACGSDAGEADGVPDDTITVPPLEGENRLPELREAHPDAGWLDVVTAAVETDPGQLTIETTIVDPRGDDGSPAARRAMRVCRAGVQLLDDVEKSKVDVMEADGTHFVVAGQRGESPGCTEM